MRSEGFVSTTSKVNATKSKRCKIRKVAMCRVYLHSDTVVLVAHTKASVVFWHGDTCTMSLRSGIHDEHERMYMFPRYRG